MFLLSRYPPFFLGEMLRTRVEDRTEMEQSQCPPTPRIYYEVRPHHLPSFEPGRIWVFDFPSGYIVYFSLLDSRDLQLPPWWKWKLRIFGQLRLKHPQDRVSTMCCISQPLNLNYMFWIQRSLRLFDSYRFVSTFHLWEALFMLTHKMIMWLRYTVHIKIARSDSFRKNSTI